VSSTADMLLMHLAVCVFLAAVDPVPTVQQPNQVIGVKAGQVCVPNKHLLDHVCPFQHQSRWLLHVHT
jgi:hypothetical protein